MKSIQQPRIKPAACGGYPYNTPSHVTCLRTKTSRSVPPDSSTGIGQIQYSPTANSAKLVLYDYWAVGNDYPSGGVTQAVEFYDFTNTPSGMTAPNYGETGNQAGSSVPATAALQSFLSGKLGTYTTAKWGGELQTALAGVATDGTTSLQGTASSVVANALGSVSPAKGYLGYAKVNFYNWQGEMCTAGGSDDSDPDGYYL